MTAIERLERLLDEEQAKREAAEEELKDIRAIQNWLWCRPQEFDAETDTLPVPRLEIVCEEVSDYRSEWLYSLVYKHLLGFHVRVPLGHTGQEYGNPGGACRPGCNFPDLPWRDGVHIRHDAATLGLPAFAIWNGNVKQLDPLPLKGAGGSPPEVVEAAVRGIGMKPAKE